MPQTATAIETPTDPSGDPSAQDGLLGLLPEGWQGPLAGHPALTCIAGIAAVVVLALLVLVVLRLVVRPLLRGAARRTRATWDDIFLESTVFAYLSWVPPALVVHLGLRAVPFLDPGLVGFVRRLLLAGMGFVVMRAVAGMLGAVEAIYRRTRLAADRPIKGYIQLGQILVHVAGAIIIVAVLLDRSPWMFVSGLGALTAVLLLVFKDTILSLVASIQLSANRMVSVGDWITMPQYGADGDVIDISLHTIKVQNWDKTISTIPTARLIDGSFRNWRGMTESGGRRIMRCIRIDLGTVRFLAEEDIERFGRFVLLREYIAEKRRALAESNRDLPDDTVSNARRLTNVGTYRAYVDRYLRARSDIQSETMTFLVRQLEPDGQGLPLQIYCFTATIAWAEYEAIQADVFDHLLAILPEFGLRAFQEPAGGDVAGLKDAVAT